MKQRGLNLPVENIESGLVRLQVYLAHCGVASRRASEQYILDGRVSVNGTVITELGTKVTSGDTVLVDGRAVEPESVRRYVLLNKPSGYVCSLADEKGRPVAAELLKPAYSERLYNVGRLDMFSTGLIIFTNDGDFAARLSHPSAELEKEYIIETSLNIPRNLASDFEKGIRSGDAFYKCVKAEQMNARKIRIVLIEGKNREIRRVFEEKQIGIKSLERVRIGNVTSDNLKTGMFRDLTEREVTGLLALCRSSTMENNI